MLGEPKSCVLPNTKYKRKPVEYRLRWVPTQNSGVGHVSFTFFVSISFALGPVFSVEYRLNYCMAYDCMFNGAVKNYAVITVLSSRGDDIGV